MGNPRDQQSCPNKDLSDSGSPQMAIESLTLVMALARANWHDAWVKPDGRGARLEGYNVSKHR